MKNISSTAIAIFIVLTACAQVKAPEAAQNAFNKQFPNAKSVKWDKENATEFEAEFKMDGKSMSANYQEDGTWTETETDIKPADLPETVRHNIEADFNGYTMKESAQIEKPGQSGLFETELKKGDETLEILWNGNGEIISKNAIDKEDEDKD